MRILAILEELQSENAGTPRQKRQLRQMLDQGHTVHVLFQRAGQWHDADAESALSAVVPKLKVPPGLNTRIPGFVRKIGRFVKQDLLFEALGKKARSLSRLITRLHQQHHFDELFVSSPSFPVFLAFSGKDQLPYKIDLRDPWALHPTLAIIKTHRKWLERRVLSRALSVTTATRGMADDIKSTYDIDCTVAYNYADITSEEFSDVSDGEMRDLDATFQAVDLDADRLSLVYCGTIPDNFYDIDKITAVLNGLLGRIPQLTLFFVGINRELNFGDHADRVVMVDRCPRRQAICYMRKADLCLFIGHKFDGYLTTKLFEYIALEKPILPLAVPETYEAAELIAAHNGFHFHIDDPESAALYLQKLRSSPSSSSTGGQAHGSIV